MKNVSPWAWVPTLYFAEGIPYVLVNTVSVIMFKKSSVGNQACLEPVCGYHQDQKMVDSVHAASDDCSDASGGSVPSVS